MWLARTVDVGSVLYATQLEKISRMSCANSPCVSYFWILRFTFWSERKGGVRRAPPASYRAMCANDSRRSARAFGSLGCLAWYPYLAWYPTYLAWYPT